MEALGVIVVIGVILGIAVLRARISVNASNARAARERAAAAQFLASAPPIQPPRPRYGATDAPPPPPA